ncbi:Lipid-A-disaccharide synthase [Frankliniella fusca]|uniref:Lipid-A-disaccharide synthase n=1 Tax=Frankliniella fusca TaxID=407009 RepID=A0AAE1HPP1_9NEOP|nr:Lipid-A-disaccharide synthase [Frankliniella fusca]
MNMNEQIRDEFLSNFKKINEKEEQRANRLKEVTENIDIAHLLIGYGRAAREALEAVLLLSSPLAFDTFLADCFKNSPNRSQDYAGEVRVKARIKEVHPSKVLFQLLPEKFPGMKASDLIESLKHARLYRAISALERCLEALPEHERSTGCPLPNSSLPISASKSGIKPDTSKKIRGNILLSFARDGKDIAEHLKSELEKPFGRSCKSYNVVKLSDFTSFIAENRVLNMKDILSRVDYIVPVLTDGYLQILSKRKPPEDATIDEELTPLLIQLTEDDWVHNGFRNRKIRCYKPEGVHSSGFGPFSTGSNMYIESTLIWRQKKSQSRV